jgi:hypothetical protein
LPLFTHPVDDPSAWRTAEAHGGGAVAIINVPLPHLPAAALVPGPPIRPAAPGPPARSTAGGPPAQPAAPWPPARSTTPTAGPTPGRYTAALVDGIARLAAAGVKPLGHVSLGYATRPLDDVIGELDRWSDLPVVGVFLDHAPAGRHQIGPVVHAVRAARRRGLRRVVLNPGLPVDPTYRWLDATICTFEGSWSEYRAWSGEDSQPGDGHLVFGVPPAERDIARAFVVARRAGLLLVAEQAAAYATMIAAAG